MSDKIGMRSSNGNPRENVFALFLFLLYAYALLWGPLHGPVDWILGGPDMAIKYPYKVFWIESLKTGDPAFWNPFTAFGFPLAAHPNTAVFSPFNVLHFLLPHTVAFSIQYLLHFVLAAFGAYWLCRRWGAGWEGGVLAGFAYGFNGFNLVHTFSGQPNLWWAAAWTPWALGFLRESLLTRKMLVLALAGACLSLGFFEGYPQTTYYSFMACALLLLMGWLGREWSFRTAYLHGIGLVAAFLVLAACQLLPSLEFVGNSNRSNWGYGSIMCDFLSPMNLWHLVRPDFLGDPLHHDWRGRWGHHEMVNYVGLAPLAFFLLGVPFMRRIKGFAFALVLSVLFAMLSLGDSTAISRGVFKFFYDFLPGFSSHRSVGRMMIMTALGIACGGAWVYSALLERLRADGNRWVSAAARIVLLFVIADLWVFGNGYIQTVPMDLYRGKNQLFPDLMVDEALKDPGYTRILPGNKINANLFYRVSQVETNDRTILFGAEAYIARLQEALDTPMPDIIGLKYLYRSVRKPATSRWREVLKDHFINANAYPRAFLVGGWQVVPDTLQASLQAMQSGMVDFRSIALLGTAPNGLRSVPGIAGEASIVHYGNTRVEITCRADRPGLLVLTDNAFPGWAATVDGDKTSILTVDGLFRGVPILRSGDHHVEFRYTPIPLFIGFAISAPAWLFLLWFFMWRRGWGSADGGILAGTHAKSFVGSSKDDSIIMLKIDPRTRSDDMAPRNRRTRRAGKSRPDNVAGVPAVEPAAPQYGPSEEPPKALVMVVRLALLLLIAFVGYKIFFKPPKDAATGAASGGVQPSILSTVKDAPAQAVAEFSKPLTLDGYVARRGYQGWGDGPALNTSVRGMTLTVAGKTYSKGIGTHAPAEIQFALNGRAERFKCLVGADQDGGGDNQVVFIIKADDKKLFQSKVMTPGTAPVPVDVDVSDAKTLYLIAKGDGSWDHADFLNARIVPSASVVSAPTPIETKKSKKKR